MKREKLEVIRDYATAMEMLNRANEKLEQAKLDLSTAENAVNKLAKRAADYEKELTELLITENL